MTDPRDEIDDTESEPAGGVESTLRRMAALEREVLAEAERSSDSSSATQIENWIRGRGDASASRPTVQALRRPQFSVIAIATIAALALCAVAWQLLLRAPRDEGRPPTELGGRTPVLSAPLGFVESFAEFRWRLPDGLPPDAYVFVEVRATGSTTILASAPVETMSWRPLMEQEQAWPNRIDWRVSVRRNNELVTVSAWESAARR